MENVLNTEAAEVENVQNEDGFNHWMREMLTLGVRHAELEAVKGEDETVDIGIDERGLFQRLREAVPEELDEEDVQDTHIVIEELIRMISRIYARSSEKQKNSFKEYCISE